LPSGEGAFERTGVAKGTARLFVNVGRVHGIRREDIADAIVRRAELPSGAIGAVDVHDQFSFVEVPAADVERVLRAMERGQIKRKRVRLEVAKER